MSSSILKCSLVVLLTCVFFAGSGARATNNANSNGAFSSASANAYAETVALSDTGASALSGANAFAGAFEGTGNFPGGAHERHKGIRSYDNINSRQDNNADRDVKSLNHHQGTKSGGHDHRKDGVDCSKCKWENDDYWEQDEPEEEGDENDGDECDDGDDGQYKPNKMHRHGGSGSRHASESHPPGVHKTGPTGVYGDNVKDVRGDRPDSPFGATNFPGSAGYTEPTSGYRSTLKPGSSWNTPFVDMSKPRYGGVTTNTFMTTPASYDSTSKSAWDGRHSDTFAGNFRTTPSPTVAGFLPSQKPGLSWNAGHDNTPIGNYGITPKPGTSWNTGIGTPTGGLSVSQKPQAHWNTGHDGTSVQNYGMTPRPGQGWNTGFSGTPTTEVSFSRKPASDWNPNHNTPAESFGTTPKPELNWNTRPGAPVARFPSSQKPIPDWNLGHDNTPAESFGTTPKPELNWNTRPGAPIARFPSSQKPIPDWNLGHDNTPAESFGTTPKPELNWNTRPGAPIARFPSSQKPIPDWNVGHDNTPDRSFGTTSKPVSGWNIGPDASTAKFPSSQKPVIPWSTGRDDTPTGSFISPINREQNRDTGLNWNPNQATTSVVKPGCTRPHASCSQGNNGPVKIGATPFNNSLVRSDESPSNISPGTSHGGSSISGTHTGADITSSSGNTPYNGAPDFGSDIYGPGNTADYNKPGNRPHTTWPSSTTNIFGTTKSPQGGFGLPGTIPGTHDDTFNPGKSPESPTGDNIHRHPGALKPSYETGITTTNPWLNTNHPAWGTTRPHAGFPVTNPGFETTKPPFGYMNTPSPYGGVKPKPSVFGTANANANSFSTYNTPSISGTSVHSIPSTHTGSSNYPGVKESFGTGPFGMQPDRGIGAWPGKQPEDGSETRPSGHPGNNAGTWPGTKSGGHSNVWPTQQSGGRNGIWPGGQIEHGSGPRCSNGSCGSSTSPSSNCERNYNCGSGCSGRSNNAPAIHGPCGEVINGPVGVNKTYYPAGTGDGNIPNIANIYESSSFPNNGNNVYPGVNIGCRRGDNSCNQGTNVTPKGSIQWNSANPFLYGSVGSISRDASRPWSGTTPKPIGQGNPFLDSSRSNPKPGNNNANNDKNVIPLGQENIKPFNKENPFLNDNKRRGDIEINTDEQVIPLGGKKPEGSNHFDAPFGSGPSYGEHPSRFPGSELPGNSDYGNIRHGLHPERVPPPHAVGSGTQPTGPLQCKFGLFGCGTPGSGSYVATKGGSIGGAHAGAYAGSFSSAQASSSSFANAKSLSFSSAGGQDNNENWPSSGAQNQNKPNSWASSDASAFASSSAGSWTGNHPVDVKS